MVFTKKTDDTQNRVPPNQKVTTGFPVLHYGDVPTYADLSKWDFRIFGLVEKETTLTYEQLTSLPMTQVTNDIHCVTGWSKLDNLWEGVPVEEVVKLAGVKPEVKYVMLHAEQGWTANMPLEDFMRPGNLFAVKHNGEPLTPDHGYPLRFVVPHLYFWKSAKWVRGVEFLEKDKPGFWEKNGYHMYGDPWKEQRFAWD
ncbi:sulfite oxidase-like oxidoreductase [Brevibacillus humidisoli]|uniref:sulfite oxidase-like oxidoreductase n=1 Tax=Brevibacillus humidisoli TaxID=2895522 RepID=UPI001E54713E|nr:sulfite oxidase-like oxidoreductase [Brevibacillus humidisoli]UFJ39644.1 sulfite oxidase-like oxidoreductase [Brevibacillus humidisoli]